MPRLRTLMAALCLTAAPLLVATQASAAPATYSVAYGNSHTQTVNGTATINRVGPLVTVSIALNPTSTFDSTAANFQVCASSAPFTAKQAGAGNCQGVPNGTFYSFTESGRSATETLTLPSAISSSDVYLQVHSDTNDSSTSNTSMACPIAATPLYGSCSVPFEGTPTPAAGPLGMVLLAGAATATLAGLTVLNRRRRRPRA